MASYWDSNSLTHMFKEKVRACLRASNVLNRHEQEFIDSMKVAFDTRNDYSEIMGVPWEPTAKQLNYLESCARKAGYR